MKWLTSVLVVLSIFLGGCGHSHSDAEVTVVVGPGTYEPFTVFLENHTDRILTPTIVTSPYSINPVTVVLLPGQSTSVSIGFLPSDVTIWATDSFGVAYPTRVIYYNVDYYSYSNSITYIYY